MKKFQKFNELSKGNKAFRIVNLVIAVLMLAASIVALVLNLKPDRHRELVTIGVLILTILPYILELIIRKRIANTILFAYQLYIIVAGVVGAVYDIYYEVFWFDRVVHTLMGYVAAMLGIFIISRVTKYEKLNVLTVVLFCFFFSLAVELVWELFEWFSDNFLGQTAQGGAFPGDVPLVTDTMEDILCNFSGAVIFCLHFIIGKFSKASLGIKSIESQLAGGQCQRKFLNGNEIIEERTQNEKEEPEQEVVSEEKPKQRPSKKKDIK